MAQDDFDLEAALRNVHPAGKRRRVEAVEHAHVFRPESKRAARTEPKGKPEQLPLRPRLPDWRGVGPGVQTAAPTDRVPALRPPVSRRKFGCAICGSESVLCQDDGAPYAHKCRHKVWCRTRDGHGTCKQCEAERVTRAEHRLRQGSAARRQFAANVKQADPVGPRVGYDLVEVVRPVRCPLCQRFLQGRRGVRVWVWDPAEQTWAVTSVQCCSHRRPGVAMTEMPAQSIATEGADVPS